MKNQSTMRIDVWSDIACPFCYIGTTQLQQAIEQFEHGSQVKVVHHSFQLNADAPRATSEHLNEMLARRKGISVEQAEAMNASVANYAAEVGLPFDSAKAIPVNTFDAHRLVHYAATQGKQKEMLQRLFRAYFANGESVADHATLIRVATEVGLDTTAVQALLANTDYADAVQADQLQAAQLGIQGVPFFIINGKYALSGAQGTEVFLDALQNIYQS